MLDPPSRCEEPTRERVALSSGETVDICGVRPGDQILIVLDVETGEEHATLPIGGAMDVKRFGDRILAITYEQQLKMFSLVSGEALWSWMTPDEYTYVRGGDAERLYVWQEATHDTFALSLADGSVVWQENLRCDWLSLTEGLLVCGETLSESGCEE